VQRGGQVALPPLAIQPGTSTYTWGESNDNPQLDLVNSLRLRVHDQPAATSVSISLRTIALADPLDIALPSQTSIVGLWQFDHAATFDPSSIDVTVHYNDAATVSLVPGESALEMFAYEDGQWQLAANLSRDQFDDWISGEFGGSFDYLAVGVPWNPVTFAPMSASSSIAFDGGGVTPTPEPSAMLIVAGGVFAQLLRRRALDNRKR
jgi:hypothetical protein